MSKFIKFLCWATTLSALLFNAQISRADDTVDLRQTGMARISFLEGAASLQHHDSDEWEPALMNLPVIAGDLIYTGPNTRIELQLLGTFLRINNITLLEV